MIVVVIIEQPGDVSRHAREEPGAFDGGRVCTPTPAGSAHHDRDSAHASAPTVRGCWLFSSTCPSSCARLRPRSFAIRSSVSASGRGTPPSASISVRARPARRNTNCRARSRHERYPAERRIAGRVFGQGFLIRLHGDQAIAVLVGWFRPTDSHPMRRPDRTRFRQDDDRRAHADRQLRRLDEADRQLRGPHWRFAPPRVLRRPGP